VERGRELPKERYICWGEGEMLNEVPEQEKRIQVREVPHRYLLGKSHTSESMNGGPPSSGTTGTGRQGVERERSPGWP